MRTAAGVVAATGAAALALGAAARSPPLMATLAGSLALGVAYSTDLPGLRWKQHPLAAAACILAVRCGGRVRNRVRAGLPCKQHHPRALSAYGCCQGCALLEPGMAPISSAARGLGRATAEERSAGAAARVRRGCMQRVLLLSGCGCVERQDRVG
jgi:hypothetical protein